MAVIIIRTRKVKLLIRSISIVFLLFLINSRSTAQILFDVPIESEVGEILRNYHYHGIQNFEIILKSDYVRELENFSGLLKYEFIDDSTVLHSWNGIEAKYVLRDSVFIYKSTPEESALRIAQFQLTSYREVIETENEERLKFYSLKRDSNRIDTILLSDNIYYKKVQFGLISESKHYEGSTGLLCQIIQYHRLQNDTIQRVYFREKNGVLVLQEDSKEVKFFNSKKRKSRDYTCNVTKTLIYNSNPLEYADYGGCLYNLTRYSRRGLIKKIVIDKNSRKRQKLIPKSIY